MKHGLRVNWRGLLAMLAVAGILAGTARAQSSWQVESIAPISGQLDTAPALAFDSQDRPQVVYGTDTTHLQHSYGNAPGAAPAWTAVPAQVVPAAYSIGRAFLASVGSSVYLGYSAMSASGFSNYAATFNGSAWTPLTLSVPTGVSAGIVGMAADGSGRVQYVLNASKAPVSPVQGFDTAGYYVFDATSSTATAAKVCPNITVLGTRYTPQQEYNLHVGGQMLFDGSGNMQTVQYYENAGEGALMYAKGQPGGPFSVTDNFDMGWQVKMGQPSMALDAAGNPCVAYTQQWPYYGVKYMSFDGTNWNSEWVEQGGNLNGYLGTYPDVLVDKTGAVHVIYADLLNGVLKDALRTSTGWQINTIDQIGTQTSTYTWNGALAAALDSRGGIGVAYWSGKDLQMKYAYLVPEPASLALLALGGLAWVRRRAGR